MTGATALLRSEWLKLRTVRSTWLVLAVAVGLSVGIGLVDALATARVWRSLSPADQVGFDPVASSFSGFDLAELAFGALGVLAISSEHATGTIRASLTAVPNRTALFAAKALVLTGLVLLVAQACAFTAFLLAQRVLAGQHLGVGLSDPHVRRAVVSVGVYTTVVAIVGFGLGALLRHTAGALTAMVGLVFLAWPVARALEGWSTLPSHWLLVNAADALVSTTRPVGPHADRIPTPGQAAVELAVYVAVLLALGLWRSGRDT